MPIASKAKQSVISLSAKWQTAFVAITILAWLSAIGVTVFSFTSKDSFINSGTWTFQVVGWLYSPVYLLIALGFVWQRYRSLLQRLFMACLVSSIGLGVFGIVHSWETALYYRYFPPDPPAVNDKSLWTAYGHDWTVMLIGVLVYAGVLFCVSRKLGARK